MKQDVAVCLMNKAIIYIFINPLEKGYEFTHFLINVGVILLKLGMIQIYIYDSWVGDQSLGDSYQIQHHTQYPFSSTVCDITHSTDWLNDPWLMITIKLNMQTGVHPCSSRTCKRKVRQNYKYPASNTRQPSVCGRHSHGCSRGPDAPTHTTVQYTAQAVAVTC